MSNLSCDSCSIELIYSYEFYYIYYENSTIRQNIRNIFVSNEIRLLKREYTKKIFICKIIKKTIIRIFTKYQFKYFAFFVCK